MVYGTDDRRRGPRETILSMIEHEAYVVVSPSTVRAWLDVLQASAL